ncbi:MAG: hypothetical protein EB059_04410 [Alphaproteobacteria bacterium]|nr:hypothetical protein [Alphaproteobacteria bacterium]
MRTIGKKYGPKVKKLLKALGHKETALDDRDEEKKSDFGEYLTQKGAMALAKRIEAYWHKKGYIAARFWAEPIGERFEKVGTYEIYRVTSNLVNGIPPRYDALSCALRSLSSKGEPVQIH